jgi:hypothetical protein
LLNAESYFHCGAPALSHGRGGGVDGTPQLIGLPSVLLLMALLMPASQPLGLAWNWETANIP